MLGKKSSVCAACKGVRRLCGRPTCPILERIRETSRVVSAVSGRSIFGATPPSSLVGEHGYPYVRFGVNVPPVEGDSARIYDYPEAWWGKHSIRDIIRLRASLVYSNLRVHVRSASNRILEAVRETVLSSTPVDLEVLLKKPPKLDLRFDGHLAPRGPSGELEKVKVAENPKVPRSVEYLVEDYDVKASQAVVELYEHGVSVYHIERLFSAGLLGQKSSRRLVPTRWAITAVDSVVSDYLLGKVRHHGEVNSVEVYRTEYIGNKYTIIVVPGPWSFEMIEIWYPRSVWVPQGGPSVFSIYELSDGVRRGPMDGGYYAIRLPVLEYLYRRGRQASVIVVREVTPDYYAPVGSWQIRESIRNAFKEKPQTYLSLEAALIEEPRKMSKYAAEALEKSKLAKYLKGQKSITAYL